MRRFSGVLHCLAVLALSLTLFTGCREAVQEIELSVSAEKINLPQSGGWVDIIVYTNTSWRLENPQGYDIVPETGTGSASLRLSVEENPNLGTPLTGNFTIKAGVLAVSVEITQAGIPPLLDIGETVAEYDYRAGSYTIHVTANLPWEAHSDRTWCLVQPVSGNGSGSLEISFGENRDEQPSSQLEMKP